MTAHYNSVAEIDVSNPSLVLVEYTEAPNSPSFVGSNVGSGSVSFPGVSGYSGNRILQFESPGNIVLTITFNTPIAIPGLYPPGVPQGYVFAGGAGPLASWASAFGATVSLRVIPAGTCTIVLSTDGTGYRTDLTGDATYSIDVASPIFGLSANKAVFTNDYVNWWPYIPSTVPFFISDVANETDFLSQLPGIGQYCLSLPEAGTYNIIPNNGPTPEYVSDLTGAGTATLLIPGTPVTVAMPGTDIGYNKLDTVILDSPGLFVTLNSDLGEGAYIGVNDADDVTQFYVFDPPIGTYAFAVPVGTWSIIVYAAPDNIYDPDLDVDITYSIPVEA